VARASPTVHVDNGAEKNGGAAEFGRSRGAPVACDFCGRSCRKGR
jgi:hypothetical protein